MSKAVKSVTKVFSAIFKPITKFLAPSVDKPKASSETSNTKQTIRSGKEPAHFIYGRTATGGVLAWAQEQKGDQTKKEKLHLAYVLAEGEIDGIEQVYVNQEPAGNFGSLVSWELHVNRSTPDPYMLQNSPDWKQSQVGRGISWVRVTLTFDQEKFSTGIPDLLFVVRGNRRIYDPRTGRTGYSDNAALCTLDYVRNRLGVSDDRIVMDAWKDAANICGEQVSDPDGVMRPRYGIGGVFRADQRKDEVLASLEQNMGGAVRRVGGYWGVDVGAYYGPARLTLIEDMVIGSVTGRTEVKRSDAINTVTGKWNSTADLWEETSYPTVRVDEWVSEDGGENSDTLDLPFSPSAHQCERLANIKLRRQRAGGQLEIPLNHAGYQFRPGRIINVDLPTINVSGEFKVLDWRFNTKSGATITVRQEDPEFYDDAVGEPFDYLSFISVPSGGIGSPTNVRYTVETVGDVVQGRLTWDPVAMALDYNVIIRQGDDVAVAVKVPGGATTCTVSGLGAGTYSASVTARGNTATSAPASVVFNILNPAKPDRVIVTASRDSIMLVPVLDDESALGGGTWEYYWSSNGDITDSEVATRAEFLSQGGSVTHTGRTPGQTYYYWIRGVNAYGKSEWYRLEAQTNENFDDIWAALAQEIEREGGLYESIVNGVTPGVIGQIDTDLSDVREQLANDGMAISELEQSSQEMTLKMLLLKAAGESNNSTIRVEQIVRADIARQLTVVQLDQARVSDDLYAMWDPESGFTARAVRMVQVGDNKAVLGLQADGETSEIGAVAGRFYVVNEVSGESVTAFVVEDGRVVMPEALISTVSIEKLRTLDGKVVIENGKIRADLIDVDTTRSKEVVSPDKASNGRPLYYLAGGTLELNSPDGGMQWLGNTQTVRDEAGRTRVKMGRL